MVPVLPSGGGGRILDVGCGRYEQIYHCLMLRENSLITTVISNHVEFKMQFPSYISNGSSFPSTSGYLAAVFARLIGPEGRVVGIDYLEPLAQLSEANVRRDDPTLLSSNRVVTLYYFDILTLSFFYISSSHDLTPPSCKQ